MDSHKEEKNKPVETTTEIATENNIPTEAQITKVIIVDFTAFSSRQEKVFFGKRMDEVRFELLQHCNTTVMHKTIEYDLSIINKEETKHEKPIENTKKSEENTFDLLNARRKILKVAKSVINERVANKLIKRSDELDHIIMNDKLD